MRVNSFNICKGTCTIFHLNREIALEFFTINLETFATVFSVRLLLHFFLPLFWCYSFLRFSPCFSFLRSRMSNVCGHSISSRPWFAFNFRYVGKRIKSIHSHSFSKLQQRSKNYSQSYVLCKKR